MIFRGPDIFYRNLTTNEMYELISLQLQTMTTEIDKLPHLLIQTKLLPMHTLMVAYMPHQRQHVNLYFENCIWTLKKKEYQI